MLASVEDIYMPSKRCKKESIFFASQAELFHEILAFQETIYPVIQNITLTLS